eukprot:Blabericola_migrator_1__2933@NODE_1844_length_3687_cov_343_381768_g1180_i0_p1_GENE_NODE_1844_length_3687_cov_343_381768_g1180_i0NODE_1844_length_3687_cov_343_381768_g1180_i0_p1_ORF_typecomplete_len489_score41_48_NODE_1844_length_3687_cov_343_381768_g1180_i07362202
MPRSCIRSGVGCSPECDVLVAVCSRLVPYLRWPDLSRIVMLNKCVHEYFDGGAEAFDLDANEFDDAFGPIVLPPAQDIPSSYTKVNGHRPSEPSGPYSSPPKPSARALYPGMIGILAGDLTLLLRHLRSITYDRWFYLREPCFSVRDIQWLIQQNDGSLCSISIQGHFKRTDSLPHVAFSQRPSPGDGGATPPVVRALQHTLPHLNSLQWSVFGVDQHTTAYALKNIGLDRYPNLKQLVVRYESWTYLTAAEFDKLVSQVCDQEHTNLLSLSYSCWDVYRCSIRTVIPYPFQAMHIVRCDGWTELAVLMCRLYIAEKLVPFNYSQIRCVPKLHVKYFLLPKAVNPQQVAMQGLLQQGEDEMYFTKYKIKIDNILYKRVRGPRDVCLRPDLFLRQLTLYTLSDLSSILPVYKIKELCEGFVKENFKVTSTDFILPLNANADKLIPPNPFVCANCKETVDFCHWQSEWSIASLGNPTDESGIDIMAYDSG